ncbi:N66 matrix protein-like isoform X2 [Bombus vosnesenskii]|uniref:N66 matrix protein-like isoform X2 n=3 Tax=Pyrobombus TaxID=144703 RepID=A0A6J3LJQ7_9HYME|nr:N66 matrix protein isoform X2 [Bombus impatiens]XP_033198427.1 N66 matrix protein-like isoform X2 [Bombus vancouverensis nearcticus]XP_033316032.1 N66 matrix protein-like isoform X2 [Bombus bifarius]XP_033364916.1 N66 matrix protein-like isoform X2 [Bombus vosnesenskii]XP_050492824.1 N66 matrix protein-like isoform X2 [Bombus huntii]
MDRVVRQLTLALMVSIGIVQCEPPLNTQYGVPGNYAGSNNNHGTSGGNGLGNHHYDNGNDNDYVDQPMSYEFGYAVKDQATGNDFGRRESSDGETVRGEYRVQLPDGRTQIVTYTADWRTGFHADVRYEGTPTYPDQYNTQNNGYNNNNNNNNQGGGQGFGFHGNNGGGGYNAGNLGNNGGYNYQAPSGSFNNGNNYPYRFGSNSLDNSYNNFGARNNYNTRTPSTTYGPAFKK